MSIENFQWDLCWIGEKVTPNQALLQHQVYTAKLSSLARSLYRMGLAGKSLPQMLHVGNIYLHQVKNGHIQGEM